MTKIKFQNVDEITKAFIEDGWNADIHFEEVTLEEAKEKGYYFILWDKKRKYFRMLESGNIFSDDGKIACYNLRGQKTIAI